MNVGRILGMSADAGGVGRLNWGCGSDVRTGWTNSDIKAEQGVDVVCDIRSGLPLGSDTLDYAVSIHSLQELSYPDVVPALRELRRVLKADGVLRLGLPDLDRGIRAYVAGRDHYFKVDEADCRSRGGRFIVHMLWYGYSRTLFTSDFIHELLLKAGFADVVKCAYKRTESRFPEIVDLDNREEETIFVEANKHSGVRVPIPGVPTDG